MGRSDFEARTVCRRHTFYCSPCRGFDPASRNLRFAYAPHPAHTLPPRGIPPTLYRAGRPCHCLTRGQHRAITPYTFQPESNRPPVAPTLDSLSGSRTCLVVRATGFEPAASRSQNARSAELSYARKSIFCYSGPELIYTRFFQYCKIRGRTIACKTKTNASVEICAIIILQPDLSINHRTTSEAKNMTITSVISHNDRLPNGCFISIAFLLTNIWIARAIFQ